ncbi:MAG: DUF167 domain-containing protein [Myxococcales bacterium]|nr:DUF167 domain-containing protein [Myxococcales bacterium]
MSAAYLREVPGGVELELWVQPRAPRDRVCGEQDGRLKVQLRAPPVDGEANSALLAFLAKLFRVPRRQVELLAGEGSRRKRVCVLGVDAGSARALLNAGG